MFILNEVGILYPFGVPSAPFDILVSHRLFSPASRLEKLAEMFLNTFHREHILLELKIKELLRKIKSKNLTAGVFLVSFLSYKAKIY